MDLDHRANSVLNAGASIEMKPDVSMPVRVSQKYSVECWRDGNLLWSDEFENLVVNTGLDDYLDKYYKGSSYTAAHYVGLTDSAPTIAATDTMASHVGWVEILNYQGGGSPTDRPSFTPGTVSSQSVDNSAAAASFAITGGATIGGAFITDNPNGAAGTLVGVGTFTGGDRTVASGDTVNVTVTVSLTSS